MSEYKFETAKLSDLYVDNKPLVSKEINEIEFDIENKKIKSDKQKRALEFLIKKRDTRLYWLFFYLYLIKKGKAHPSRVGSPIIKKSDSRRSLRFLPVSVPSIA